ncbi:hypothetical protein BIS07_16060, partial [Halomonas sp. FL8]
LLQQGMQQQAAPPQQRPSPQAGPQQRPQPQQPQQGDPRTDTDPQQGQQMYNALMKSMLGYLYGPGMPQVEQALNQGDDIVQRMATVISSVMLTTYHALNAEGKTVPPGVMFQAGMELAKAVGEIAVEMRKLPGQGNAEPIEAAFMAGIGRFGQLVQDGAMTQQQKQRYAEMIRAMRQLKQQAGKRPAQQSQTQTQPQEAR